MTRHPLPAVSFRDAGGFVYEDEGCILRQDPEVQTREAGSPGRFSQSAMLGLIESLESTVKGLSWKPGRSTWVAYSKESTYSPAQTDRKSRFIAEFLELVRPASVWDLGANTGNFSWLSSDRGIPTVAVDFDPACVEVNYREVKKRHETKLLKPEVYVRGNRGQAVYITRRINAWVS